METLFILLPLLLLSLTVHEFAHAIVAYKLGDPTPKMQGRVTLNPLAHLDPLGTLLIIVTSFTGIGFGWGKPVVFNPANLRQPKRDVGLVAFAGPLSNILMGTLGIVLLPFLATTPLFPPQVILSFIVINFVLAVFNLIPIYPLDGFNVVLSLLPHGLSEQFAETAKYGMFVLLALVLTGATKIIINPVVEVLIRVIGTVVG